MKRMFSKWRWLRSGLCLLALSIVVSHAVGATQTKTCEDPDAPDAAYRGTWFVTFDDSTNTITQTQLGFIPTGGTAQSVSGSWILAKNTGDTDAQEILGPVGFNLSENPTVLPPNKRCRIYLAPYGNATITESSKKLVIIGDSILGLLIEHWGGLPTLLADMAHPDSGGWTAHVEAWGGRAFADGSNAKEIFFTLLGSCAAHSTQSFCGPSVPWLNNGNINTLDSNNNINILDSTVSVKPGSGMGDKIRGLLTTKPKAVVFELGWNDAGTAAEWYTLHKGYQGMYPESFFSTRPGDPSMHEEYSRVRDRIGNAISDAYLAAVAQDVQCIYFVAPSDYPEFQFAVPGEYIRDMVIDINDMLTTLHFSDPARVRIIDWNAFSRNHHRPSAYSFAATQPGYYYSSSEKWWDTDGEPHQNSDGSWYLAALIANALNGSEQGCQ